jgi:FLYWCH zinc finger domain
MVNLVISGLAAAVCTSPRVKMTTSYKLHGKNLYFSNDGRLWQCVRNKDLLCESTLMTDGGRHIRKEGGVHNHPPTASGGAHPHENVPVADPDEDDDDDMTQDDASSVGDPSDESLQTLVTARDVWLPALSTALDDILQRRHPEASDTKEGGFLLPLLGAISALGALASKTHGKRKT